MRKTNCKLLFTYWLPRRDADGKLLYCIRAQQLHEHPQHKGKKRSLLQRLREDDPVWKVKPSLMFRSYELPMAAANFHAGLGIDLVYIRESSDTRK